MDNASEFNQIDPATFAAAATSTPPRTPFYKNKTILIIIGAIFLIALTAILFFVFNKKPATSLDLPSGRLDQLSQIPITEATLSDRTQLSQTIINWFDRYQIAGEPYAGMYTCTGDACLPGMQTPVHRDTIPLIWARNRYYVQNPNPDQLAKLTQDIDSVYQWTRPDENGNGYIWQVNNYHCYLIEQILNSNQELSQDAKDQLTTICSEAQDEGDRHPFTSEEEIMESSYAALGQKYQSLLNNNAGFDWENDLTYAHYQSLNTDFSRDQQNVIYVAEALARINVSPRYNITVTFLNYLDTAVNAYHHSQSNPDSTLLEQELIRETMINSLSNLQNQYATEMEYYQLHLPELISSLKAQTSDLNIQNLLVDLLDQKNLNQMAQLCFVESQPAINYNQNIVNALISYHRFDADRDKKPFYYLADTGDYMILTEENGLLAGCVLYEI